MQYYYLIASLPNNSAEIQERAIDLPAIRQHIEYNLTPEDRRLFQYLLYRNDNKNLLYQLRIREGLRDESHLSFHEPAAFSYQEIEEGIAGDFALPSYMIDFLDLKRRRQIPAGHRQRENLLKKMYYSEALALPDPFLRRYFRFKQDLKNILSLLNARKYGIPEEEALVGEAGLAGLIQTSGFSESVFQAYSFAADLRACLEARDFETLERRIDSILAECVENLTGVPDFSRSVVFALFIKLSLAYRWLELEKKTGAIELEKIIARIVMQASWPLELRGVLAESGRNA